MGYLLPLHHIQTFPFWHHNQQPNSLLVVTLCGAWQRCCLLNMLIIIHQKMNERSLKRHQFKQTISLENHHFLRDRAVRFRGREYPVPGGNFWNFPNSFPSIFSSSQLNPPSCASLTVLSGGSLAVVEALFTSERSQKGKVVLGCCCFLLAGRPGIPQVFKKVLSEMSKNSIFCVFWQTLTEITPTFYGVLKSTNSVQNPREKNGKIWQNGCFRK